MIGIRLRRALLALLVPLVLSGRPDPATAQQIEPLKLTDVRGFLELGVESRRELREREGQDTFDPDPSLTGNRTATAQTGTVGGVSVTATSTEVVPPNPVSRLAAGFSSARAFSAAMDTPISTITAASAASRSSIFLNFITHSSSQWAVSIGLTTTSTVALAGFVPIFYFNQNS